MKVAVFFPLLLLVCSVSTDPIKRKADDNFIENRPYEPVPYDIHAVLREMTASLAAQRVEIRELQKDNEAQAEKLKELDKQKTEVDKKKGEVDKLKTEVDKQKSEVDKLKTEVDKQKTEVDKQKTEVDKLKTEVDKQKTDVDKQKQQLQARQVAFSVGLLDDGIKTLGPFNTHTTLVFRYVATNIGHTYNSKTGVFTAPVKGAYHFEFYVGVHGDNHHPSAVVLVKNQDDVFRAYERQASHYGSTSNGVTLILEVGDKVFLRLIARARIYDDHRHHYSSFSGHLLFIM